VIIGLIGGNLASIIVITILYNWEDKSLYIIIGVLLGSFLIGVLFATLLHCVPHLGYILKGFITGAVLGIQVYGVVIGIKGDVLKPSSMLIIICAFALVGTCLSTIFKEASFVVSTAYLGSFFIFRGFGSMFGNYPSSFHMKSKMPHEYYMYFGLILGLSVLGIILQLILKQQFPVDKQLYTYHSKNQIKVELINNSGQEYNTRRRRRRNRGARDSNLNTHTAKNNLPVKRVTNEKGDCEFNTEVEQPVCTVEEKPDISGVDN
jgi:hypothetical protein